MVYTLSLNLLFDLDFSWSISIDKLVINKPNIIFDKLQELSLRITCETNGVELKKELWSFFLQHNYLYYFIVQDYLDTAIVYFCSNYFFNFLNDWGAII